MFEDRVSRSLKSLGVPTQDDIQTLTKRVEELSKAVSALSGKKVAAPRTTAAKAAKPTTKTLAAKPAAKKTAAKAATKRAATK